MIQLNEFCWREVFWYIRDAYELIQLRQVSHQINNVAIDALMKMNDVSFVAATFNLMKFGINLRTRSLHICNKCTSLKTNDEKIINFDYPCNNDCDHDFHNFLVDIQFNKNDSSFTIAFQSYVYNFRKNSIRLITNDVMWYAADYDQIHRVSATETWGIKISERAIKIYQSDENLLAVIVALDDESFHTDMKVCENQIDCSDAICFKSKKMGSQKDVIHYFRFTESKEHYYQFNESKELKFYHTFEHQNLKVIACNDESIIFQTSTHLIAALIQKEKYVTTTAVIKGDKGIDYFLMHSNDNAFKNFYYFDHVGLKLCNNFKRDDNFRLRILSHKALLIQK